MTDFGITYIDESTNALIFEMTNDEDAIKFYICILCVYRFCPKSSACVQI